MTDPVTESHLQEIARKAVDAAQLATEAAHEAEAAIAARNEAAQALGKTARQTQWLSLGAVAGSILILASGGLFWARASSHLGQAAEVQAAATAGFIENLVQMNTALDQMQQVIDASTDAMNRSEQEVAVLIARLDQRLGDVAQDFAGRLDLTEAASPAPAEVLIALAELEMRLSRQISDLVVPAPAAVASAVKPQQSADSASPTPSQQARNSRAVSRPAPRPAPPPQPNPFSFP